MGPQRQPAAAGGAAGAGRGLGDLYGRRRVFILGTAAFAGASAVGGLAPDFPMLLACRVVQGAGGALMLPNTVAIVAAAFTAHERGRALGLMGGVSAVAGAFGLTIGGVLTAALSWRAVLLVNCPLAVLTIAGTLRAVAPDPPGGSRPHVDLRGAFTLSVALVTLVFGLSQSQAWGWGSPGVWLPLVVSVVAAALFVAAEPASASPLLQFALLGRHRNYLGATISQFIPGIAEMGLGLLFPLLLILNLKISPALAGLALIPATVPMVLVAPLAGRWYDRSGGRVPLSVGFAVLLASGVVLAWAAFANAYLPLLPGLLLYGTGLALVLTVNDPVSLDTIPAGDNGQASGVSATAEQFGGAVGIALLYLIFHATYLNLLYAQVNGSTLPKLSAAKAQQFKNAIAAAESTGLRPQSFDSSLARYLLPARTASADGYAAAFVAVSVLALIALVLVLRLIRKPPEADEVPAGAQAPADAR